MATLLTTPVHGLVGIDYKHFTIQSRGLTEPPRFPFDQPHNLILPIRDALAIFVAGDYTAYALVHLEAWDGEPTAGAPAHSDTETQTVRFTVADISAQGAMATAPDTGELRLSAPGPYHVRVHRWGVEDVNRVFDANPNAIIHRSERFIVQFWPADDRNTVRHHEPPALSHDQQLHTAIRTWATGHQS
ncbi:hypothetical protein ACFQ73_02345 [Amycolatopsis japonica]|uniref:hypothetical protein n=1 Tax=Amycolatopsis japonica TaxID=208439 RepID=UPI00367249BD